MKKYALAILLLAALASGEVSQEQAGIMCNPYASDGETIQVLGPMTCEGAYWICDFSYYGNQQNLVIPINKISGATLDYTGDLLEDLLSVKYATDYGGSYIFGTLLTSENFAIQLGGMNNTLQNYVGILKTLKDEKQITKKVYDEFDGMITSVKAYATRLSGEVEELINMSERFSASPDCVELLDYIWEMNGSLSTAENFSASWIDFITRYNVLVGSIEGVYVASINPSDAQIMQRDLEGIGTALTAYIEGEQEFITKATANLKTRYDRKDTKGRLEQAYTIVSGSANQEAINKYNQASAAFKEGRYDEAKGLIVDALALASTATPTNGNNPVTTSEKADYSRYFILAGILVVILVFVMLLRKKADEPDDEPDDKESREDKFERKKSKAEKREDWVWVNEDKSAMEKKASL